MKVVVILVTFFAVFFIFTDACVISADCLPGCRCYLGGCRGCPFSPFLKDIAGQPVCDETNCPLDIGLCSESGICVHHSIKKVAPPPCVLGRECPNGCGCLHGKCLCRRPFLNTFNPNQGPESNEQQPPPFCAIVTDCPRGYQCVDNECVLGPTAFVETLEEEEVTFHAPIHAPLPCETRDDCPHLWPYACEHGICVNKCKPGNAC